MFKRAIWRAVRATVAATLGGLVGGYAQAHGIEPVSVSGVTTGVLMFLDKIFRDAKAAASPR